MTTGVELPSYVNLNENNKLLIVFAHGLQGDGKSTWTNDKTKTYWPDMVATDTGLECPSVYVFQYRTSLTKSELSIDQIGSQLQAFLKADGAIRFSSIVFIAHSMGGLITRNMLLKSDDILNKTSLLYMLGVPTQGGNGARVASIFSRNKQVANLVASSDGEDFLLSQERLWLASKNASSIPQYCAYEVQPTLKLTRIVDMRSAVALSNREPLPIHENHIDLVKPSSRRHPSYIGFIAALHTDYSSDSISGPLLTISKLDTQDISSNICFSFTKLENELEINRIRLKVISVRGPINDASYMAIEQLTITRSQIIDPLDVFVGAEIDIPVRVTAERDGDCFFVDYFPTLATAGIVMSFTAQVSVLSTNEEKIESFEITYPSTEQSVNITVSNAKRAFYIDENSQHVEIL